MNRFARRLRGGFSGVALTGLLLAAPSAFALQTAEPTRVAVIDIDRIAQESARGQAMFTELQSMQEEILRGRQSRDQEIRDLTNRAQSQLLSAEARADLTRDIERKNTDLQRWLEDQQRSFNDKPDYRVRVAGAGARAGGRRGGPRAEHPVDPPGDSRPHVHHGSRARHLGRGDHAVQRAGRRRGRALRPYPLPAGPG